MAKRQPRNLLLLGAVLLIVGIVIEYLEDVVLHLNLNIVAKTIVIMFMIAFGFGFASVIMMPWARKVLVVLMRPFKRAGGNKFGRMLFYVVIYVVLFFVYLLYFIL